MKKVKKMYKTNEKFLQYTDIPCPHTVTEPGRLVCMKILRVN